MVNRNEEIITYYPIEQEIFYLCKNVQKINLTNEKKLIDIGRPEGVPVVTNAQARVIFLKDGLKVPSLV